MKRNIFIKILDVLGVKYTLENATRLYFEHPDRDNLYGLSSLLKIYDIDSFASQLDNKYEIRDIETPFVAFYKSEFVLVVEIGDNDICYLNKKREKDTIENFVSNWSGIALLIEKNERSIEPNYYENHKKEVIKNILSLLFCCVCGSCFLYISLNTRWWVNFNILIVGILLCGLYVCFIMLKKQLGQQSDRFDNLCHLFVKGDCSEVLESDASMLFDVFSWSEIGFWYFLSSFFICIMFPLWIPYFAWIHILTLPYTFWSVCYQYFKVKKWCPMCLFIMGIFWILFAVFWKLEYFQKNSFDFWDATGVVLCYIFSFLIIHQSISILMKVISNRQLIYEMNKIKLNENIFLMLLKKGKHYEVSLSVSKIVFGNIESKILITVLTNPYCKPCEEMHFRIKSLLKRTSNRYCIQYIFTSFNKPLSVANKMLICAYFKDIHNAINLYDLWFKKGKYQSELFLERII